ncbi:MAG: hypothetical protein QOF18_2003 [Frankiaceae bacterium]|jgi:hypothetical protein|nr:hypothetical protein [Frankiaceae bacterium]
MNTSSDLGDLLGSEDPISDADLVSDPGDRDSDDWLTPSPHKKRPSLLTGSLAGATLLAAAFTGGVLVQKSHDQQLVSAATAPGGFPGGRSAGFAGGGFAGGGAPGAAAAPATGASAAGPAVIGVVVSQHGQVLTIRNLAGKTVLVTVPTGIAITEQRPLALNKLAAGSNVVVTGTTSARGAVTATAVTVH